jgi:hypothetical protein
MDVNSLTEDQVTGIFNDFDEEDKERLSAQRAQEDLKKAIKDVTHGKADKMPVVVISMHKQIHNLFDGFDRYNLLKQLAINLELSNVKELDDWITEKRKELVTVGDNKDLVEQGNEPELIMADAAFHGLSGDFVRLVIPHTEADPVALLINFITAFGHCADRNFYYLVESKRHHGNLFIVLIGSTSKARKGTSLSPVTELFKNEIFKSSGSGLNTVGGLVSGEGLIYQVRDPEIGFDVKKQAEIIADPGVKDKRLLIIEEEFVSILKVIQRQGNTLSDVLRKAWDGNETLRTLAKNSHNKATGAHISLIGHITQEEFKKELTGVEIANGFGNRFLYFGVKRSKCLPFGSGIYQVNIEDFTKRLKEALDFAQLAGQIKWAKETRPIWADIYPELSDGKKGLRGALTARAEAQAVRLATLYAVMDKSTVIKPEHLEAAIAVVEYSEATVKSIFTENTTGDDSADRILKALKEKPEGLTQSEIFTEVFKKNKPSKEIQRAINLLIESKKIIVEVKDSQSAGRPKTTYKIYVTRAGLEPAPVT